MDFESIINELNLNEYKYDDKTLANIYFELENIIGDLVQEQSSNIVLKRVNNAIFEFWKNNLTNVSYSELDYMLHKQYDIANSEYCYLLLDLYNIGYNKKVFKWELLSIIIDKIIRC